MANRYDYSDRVIVEFERTRKASYSRKRYGPLLENIVNLSMKLNKKIWNYFEEKENHIIIYYYEQSTSSVVEFIIDNDFKDLIYDYYFQTNCNGYPQTRTNGKKQFLHHMVMGTNETIDHINGNVKDNRLCNLRVTTSSLNNLNRRFQSNNTSGCIGVSWSTKDQKWRARISYQYQERCKYFDDFESAVQCRKQWELEILNNNYNNNN